MVEFERLCSYDLQYKVAFHGLTLANTNVIVLSCFQAQSSPPFTHQQFGESYLTAVISGYRTALYSAVM